MMAAALTVPLTAYGNPLEIPVETLDIVEVTGAVDEEDPVRDLCDSSFYLTEDADDGPYENDPDTEYPWTDNIEQADTLPFEGTEEADGPIENASDNTDGFGYTAEGSYEDTATADSPAQDGDDVKKDTETLAYEVIQGKWGNGQFRKDQLSASGYDHAAIQARVNDILS